MQNHNNDKYFLASIVENSNDSIITIDLDMAITSWNKAAEVLYGYRANDVIGRKLTTVTLPKEDYQPGDVMTGKLATVTLPKDFHELLLRIEKIKENRQIEMFESKRVGKDKAHTIHEIVVSPVNDDDGELIGISTIARDVTVRRLAEKASRDKELLQRLVVAKEDERSRISRDLHDDLGQQLTGLQFAVARARSECSDPAMEEHINALSEIANALDKSVDFLAWELRPALVERVGLAAAIENYAKQWARHAGVKAEVLIAPIDTRRLASTAEANLYRIVQESLNNIHKHAGASGVEVILEQRDDSIVLIIADDGKGFRLSSKKVHTRGLGLTGMRERAAVIGAVLDIETAPRRGTTLHVRLPITQKRHASSSKPPPLPTGGSAGM